ncbi:hypothetical protein DW888_16090 [Bacteroides nordii]|uniref:Uncharacterized protein n=2 Tax=Bacteroides nordii TaxID=291645 RepID=A0A413VIH7_9BACE|nr:hypothetical protein DW888_16090 [Bacteroides nordii]
MSICRNCGKPVEIEMPELEKEISGVEKSCLKNHKIDRKIHSISIKIYVYYNIFAFLFGVIIYSAYLCSIIPYKKKVSLNIKRMRNGRESDLTYPFIIRKSIKYYLF